MQTDAKDAVKKEEKKTVVQKIQAPCNHRQSEYKNHQGLDSLALCAIYRMSVKGREFPQDFDCLSDPFGYNYLFDHDANCIIHAVHIQTFSEPKLN